MSDSDSIDQFGVREYERSLFLTCICVFTWIGCWFVILYYGLHIIKISEIERSVYHFEDYRLEYYLMKAGVISPVISATGAIFMWKMKRFGFFIYCFGQASLCVLGLYVYFVVKPPEFPMSYIMIAAFVGQLSFIALYAMNWKYMR